DLDDRDRKTISAIEGLRSELGYALMQPKRWFGVLRRSTFARAVQGSNSIEGLNVKHDISIPIPRIAEFVRVTDAALQQALPGVRLVNFGHLGDGNLHYNVQAPPGADGARFLQDNEQAVNTLVFTALQPFEGSFSAEHGIGALKRDELARRKSPVALRLMHAIKAAFDPQGLLNPGRVLAPEPTATAVHP
ncbi:MAG: hypothetical protein H7Z19_17095, partial [Chitinophagaceae bacterium]|nr:hypothetical protein [Rubrivivax sp.]